MQPQERLKSSTQARSEAHTTQQDQQEETEIGPETRRGCPCARSGSSLRNSRRRLRRQRTHMLRRDFGAGRASSHHLHFTLNRKTVCSQGSAHQIHTDRSTRFRRRIRQSRRDERRRTRRVPSLKSHRDLRGPERMLPLLLADLGLG